MILERERGEREGEIQRNIDVREKQLPPVCSLMGIEPTMYIYALTKNGNHNLLWYRMTLQPTEPPSPGSINILNKHVTERGTRNSWVLGHILYNFVTFGQSLQPSESSHSLLMYICKMRISSSKPALFIGCAEV